MKAGFFFSILLSLLAQLSLAQYQYQALMNYLESRMTAIEERISVWNEQNNRYNIDLKKFRLQATDLLEKLGKEHVKLQEDLEGAKLQVDRVEREMDFMETKHPPKPCVKAADKIVEQKPVVTERKKKDEFFEVSVCVDLVSNIRAMKILKRLGSTKGVWTKDARTAKVYIFNGTSDDTLYEFKSVKQLSASSGMSKSKQITLPSAWNGTGHAVYDGFLYYITETSELKVNKFHLENRSLVDNAVLPVQEQVSVYSLNPETIVDLIADEEGLWALYAIGTINLAKMDSDTLDIEHMWETSCSRINAEAAFFVCGTLYVVYNTRPPSRAKVQCVFDVNDMVTPEEAPLFYFPRRFGTHSSLKYNPVEKQVYAWDDGYQILYRMSLKKKLFAIMPPPEE
ncbi:Olfactomedin-like protein 3B [Bagarius yarrelli]|uniref:Olfactomedin-like protein 3B n=1 Tax=Bagarius yarrelli TaxID=175774 RepID=A0A556U0F8_BAGYA|nr:Olfactomedin-like protein 3B [Bagarius yarrelli]